MKKIFCFLFTAIFGLNLQTAEAKLPGNIYVAAHGGLAFPGIASPGSSFTGREIFLGLAYRPFPESNVGLQAEFGFQINSYRHNFEKDIFLTHIQKGFSFNLLAVVRLTERSRIVTGIAVNLPYTAFVDIGQRNFNQTYYFGNDSLMERYVKSPLQPFIVLGMEYSFGKTQNVSGGLRITHAGISPVKETAVYYDGLGHSTVISRQMKAMSIQLSVSVRIKKRRKKDSD